MMASETIIASPRSAKRTGVVRRRVETALLPLGFIAICLAGAEILVRALGLPEVLLPPPSRVLAALVANIGVLLHHAILTMIQVVGALVLSTLFGVLLASLFTLVRTLNDMIAPLLVLLQIVPKIALAPLFVVWLGTGAVSHLGFAVFLSFFPMLIAAQAGFEESSADAVRLCRALGATALQTLLHVRMPMALPHLFVGAKIATTLCIIGVVLGEFISAQAGIGWYILQASAMSQTANMIAALIVLSILGVGVFGVVSAGEIYVRRKFYG
jgi:NitT/TauT family transport system permease protein